ncbi:MAG TPA: cupredoxin domain-containing protein [Actinomycetota bacterium]|nr:cupredoxin domain-containing protein [Actinomycetota bacterium]
MSQPEEVAPQAETTEPSGVGWKSLLKWSAIVSILVVVLVNIFAGIIPPLIVFAVLWLVGVVWLGRSTKGPAIFLLALFIANVALSAPFTIPSFAVPASAGDFILNAAHLLAALVGIVAAIAVLRRASDTSGTPRKLALGATALFVVGTIFSIIAAVGYENATAQEGDIEMVTADIEFSDTSLEAAAGEIGVFVENEDATFHTFTIDELDVSLDIPAAKSARISFQAEPGTYEFYCVPHQGDMEGTLTVE